MYLEKEYKEENKPWIYRPICGIYFLIDIQNIVVYVGKSVDIFGRLSFHFRSEKVFEKIAVLQFAEEELERMEAVFIAKYQPKFNKSWPGGESGFARYNPPKRMKKEDMEKLKTQFLNDPAKCFIEHVFFIDQFPYNPIQL